LSEPKLATGGGTVQQDTSGAQNLERAAMDLTPRDELDSWYGSTERQRAQSRAVLLLMATIASSGGAALFISDTALGASNVRLIVGVLLGIVAATTYVGGFLTLTSARARFRTIQRQRLREAQQRTSEQLGEGADVAKLLEVSRSDMETYRILSQDQARGSYIMSQVSSAIGGLILVAGAVAAILISGTTNKVAVASLTALGGALSGYISRTFLRVYERSLLQLNFFFQVPLVSNYVLTAERLTTKMSKDQRDKSYENVIATVLDISTRSISASESLITRETGSQAPTPEKDSNSEGTSPPSS
jgi:hypothetical protein